ncbi:MAG TPA: DUF1631 family protein, partial [Desulfobacteraceae bacterium]|nr:DUF1631 family protein [Desulfobacteraceae bacterium]
MSINYNFRYLINEWQQHVMDVLSDKLRQQLNATDEVLMNFADKAESITVQNHFFEAQREIWLKSEDIAIDFNDLLMKYLEKSPRSDTEEQPTLASETLSLVNIDLYERNLGLQTLAERTEKRNYRLLYALAQRLSVVNGGHPVEIADIPASPRQMVEIFARCVDRLSMEHDALLVLYTLYDKYVLSELEELHQQLNQELKNAGILPNLKYEVVTTPKGAPSTETPKQKTSYPVPSQPQTTEELGDETLARIQQLLMAKRNRNNRKNPLSAGVEAATSQEVAQATNNLINHEDVSFPASMQLGKAVSRTSVNAEEISKIHRFMSNQRSALKESIGVDRLLDEQENIIDLIGMLFEHMLDDERIPDVDKALLGHLHTPYIKIGLLESGLFSSDKHPARLFLDQAIEAAALWTNESDLDAGIYPFLKDIVFHIVRLKHQEHDDFIRFSGMLKDKVKSLEEKFNILERNSLQAEEGKELISQAKSTAESATGKIFDGQEIPDCVGKFIKQAWIDYLTLLYLREGAQNNSPVWEEALDLGHYLLSTGKAAVAGTVQQTQLDTLSEQLLQQVGGLLPHKRKDIEHLIQALTEKPGKQMTLQVAREVKTIPPQINPEILAIYKKL